MLKFDLLRRNNPLFRFMFGTVLRKPEMRMDIPMAKVPKRLPQILTRGEVSRLIDAALTMRGLATTYAAGLRLSELCALQLTDIESAPDRMCIKVRQGKGGEDRYTLLSPLPVGHAAPLLARSAATHLALSQPFGQCADRDQDGATHLLRRARRRRHRP